MESLASEDRAAARQRLKEGSIPCQLSEVKGPVLNHLKRSNLLPALNGTVRLTWCDTVSSIKRDWAGGAVAARRLA